MSLYRNRNPGENVLAAFTEVASPDWLFNTTRFTI